MPDIPEIEESVGAQLMRALYDQVTTLRTPWVVTPQQMQQQVLDSLRAAVDDAVRKVVRHIATGDFQHIPARIESIAAKANTKVALSIEGGTEELHKLIDHVGGKALIVFAEPEDYLGGLDALRAQTDQPELPLE